MSRGPLRVLAVSAVLLVSFAVYTLLSDATRQAGARSTATTPSGASQLTVATGGSDAGPCTSSHPCATLGGAYQHARAGRTSVLIEPGSYPVQTIAAAVGHTGPAPRLVSYRPATPGSVKLDELIVDAPNVEIAGVHTAGWTILGRGSHVTLRDVVSTAATFVNSAQHVRILGGSISSVGRYVINGPQVKAAEDSSVPPRDVLFDGVAFHDFLRAPGSSNHVDCLQVMAADGLVIRRSTFWNCEAFDILFTVFGEAGSPRHVLLENNFFQCCHTGYYSVQLGGGHGEQWRDIEMRNNTADSPLNVDSTSAVPGPVRVIGNIAPDLPSGACRAGVKADWNVWASGRRCGPHDRIARSGFTPGGDADFHLIGCPPAVGRADPDDAPAVDIDGQKRPVGNASDAGADEAAACS